MKDHIIIEKAKKYNIPDQNLTPTVVHIKPKRDSG